MEVRMKSSWMSPKMVMDLKGKTSSRKKLDRSKGVGTVLVFPPNILSMSCCHVCKYFLTESYVVFRAGINGSIYSRITFLKLVITFVDQNCVRFIDLTLPNFIIEWSYLQMKNVCDWLTQSKTNVESTSSRVPRNIVVHVVEM